MLNHSVKANNIMNWNILYSYFIIHIFLLLLFVQTPFFNINKIGWKQLKLYKLMKIYKFFCDIRIRKGTTHKKNFT